MDELTRRDWLVRIGKTAAVAGLSGEVSGAGAALSSLVQSAPRADTLPPGLYEPSNDHLTHALGADGLLHPVPLGSETDYRVPLSGPYAPKFFSASRRTSAVSVSPATTRIALLGMYQSR